MVFIAAPAFANRGVIEVAVPRTSPVSALFGPVTIQEAQSLQTMLGSLDSAKLGLSADLLGRLKSIDIEDESQRALFVPLKLGLTQVSVRNEPGVRPAAAVSKAVQLVNTAMTAPMARAVAPESDSPEIEASLADLERLRALVDVYKPERAQHLQTALNVAHQRFRQIHGDQAEAIVGGARRQERSGEAGVRGGLRDVSHNPEIRPSDELVKQLLAPGASEEHAFEVIAKMVQRGIQVQNEGSQRVLARGIIRFMKKSRNALSARPFAAASLKSIAERSQFDNVREIMTEALDEELKATDPGSGTSIKKDLNHFNFHTNATEALEMIARTAESGRVSKAARDVIERERQRAEPEEYADFLEKKLASIDAYRAAAVQGIGGRVPLEASKALVSMTDDINKARGLMAELLTAKGDRAKWALGEIRALGAKTQDEDVQRILIRGLFSHMREVRRSPAERAGLASIVGSILEKSTFDNSRIAAIKALERELAATAPKSGPPAADEGHMTFYVAALELLESAAKNAKDERVYVAAREMLSTELFKGYDGDYARARLAALEKARKQSRS